MLNWRGLMLFVVFGWACSGCTPPAPKVLKKPEQPKPTHYRTVRLKPFHHLILGQHLRVKLRSGQHNRIGSRYLNMVHIDQSQTGVLRIDSTYPNKNLLYLSAKQLPNHIILNGNSRLFYKVKKSSAPLKITANAPGSIRLSGWFNLVDFDNPGGADLYAYWLNSQQTHIFSQAGRIFLAGRCQHLLAKLDGESKLDAYNLVSKHVWLMTSGSAMAKVKPSVSLNAQASQNSQVAYFNQLPLSQVTRHVFDQGNVVFVDRYFPTTRGHHWRHYRAHQHRILKDA